MHGIAWYCMVLHGIVWYCMVLHGMAWFCMVFHGFTWYCMVLHGIALYCIVWHYLAPSCTILHHVAPSCTMLSDSFFQTKNIKCKTTISIDVNFEMFWYSMKLVWFWCDLLLQRWIVIAWKMAGGKKSREVERNWKVAAGSSSNILLKKRRLWINSSISSNTNFSEMW